MLGRDVPSVLGLSLRTKTAQTLLATGMMMLSMHLKPRRKPLYDKQFSTTYMDLSRTHHKDRA
jgi:hypothetical protein